MSKQTVTIQFKSIVQLWRYAQIISCHSMEIIAADKVLICECSENDIAMLSQYGGSVIKDHQPVQKLSISNHP